MAKELKLYLPIIIQDIAEYEAMSNAVTPLIEDLETKTNQIVNDSFLSTMSETRLIEWEKALGIIPTNTSLERRRSIVLSRFRGTGKLNKTLINSMVKAFTGGTSTVILEDGVLKVRISPPTSTFIDFSTESLLYELQKRKPAHLLLTIELTYINWGQVNSNFDSWEDISNTFTDWDELYKYYIKQEGYSLWR